MEDEHFAKIVMCAIMLVLSVLAVLRSLWRKRTWLQNTCRKVVSHLRAWLSDTVDPVEQRVAAMRSSRRTERAKEMTLLISMVAAIAEATALQQHVVGAPNAVLPLGRLIFIQSFILIGVLLSLFPGIISEKTARVFFFVSILLLAGAVLFGEFQGQNPQGLDLRLWLAVALLCFFHLEPWLNTIGLMIVAAVRTGMDGQSAMQSWAVCCILSMTLTWIDHVLTASIRQEILAIDSGCQLTAIKSMLVTICDAVVELDANLRITHHSAKLSNLLLHGPRHSVQGTTMQDFMSTERDWEKFVEMVSDADKASSHAEVFHATLRDSNAIPISMEFFSVAFAGPDAHRRHLLGMREFTDTHPLAPPQEPQQNLQTPAAPERAARQHWPGTPPSAERDHFRDQAPAPDAASEISSSNSSSSSRIAAATGPARRRETAQRAKLLTLADMLATWCARLPAGSCCPRHALLADLATVAALLGSMGCDRTFGQESRWQCERCGIRGEEYRERHRGGACALCVHLETLDGPNGERSVAL